METPLEMLSAKVFGVMVHSGRAYVILAALMDCRAIRSSFLCFGTSLAANRAFQVFIAAIIAGMPIRFMTRVIL